jgi:hypothetical protein
VPREDPPAVLAGVERVSTWKDSRSLLIELVTSDSTLHSPRPKPDAARNVTCAVRGSPSMIE